jgi:hypothetical protein
MTKMTRLDPNLEKKVVYIDYSSPEERENVSNVKKRSSEGAEQKVNNENNPTLSLTTSEVCSCTRLQYSLLQQNNHSGQSCDAANHDLATRRRRCNTRERAHQRGN